MIRYRYSSQVNPPAPFVHVTLRRPDGKGAELGEWPAQLDTGADKTVIPWRVVEELQLVPVREVATAGLGGTIRSMPTFLVEATIRQMPAIMVEALASAGEPYILLGRDVLNHYRILLDGPRLVLEFQ